MLKLKEHCMKHYPLVFKKLYNLLKFTVLGKKRNFKIKKTVSN